MQNIAIEGEKETAYGHRHLGLWFSPKMTVSPLGIRYKDQLYAWADVKKLVETKGDMVYAVGYPFGKPSATIVFQNGKKLNLDGRSFMREGSVRKIKFFTGVSEDFEIFLDLVRRRMSDQQK